jgi:hypothetical protein
LFQEPDVFGALSSDVEDHSKRVQDLLQDLGTPEDEFRVYTGFMEGAVNNGPFIPDAGQVAMTREQFDLVPANGVILSRW